MATAVTRRTHRRLGKVEAQAKRSVGRPMKEPTGKRAQIGILLRAEVKRALMKAAQEHGRTLSQEAEHWLERLLQYETALGTPAEALVPALLRLGYTPVRPAKEGGLNPKEGGGFWTVWAEPGYPGFSLELSGYQPETEEAWEAVRARMAKEEPK